VDRIGAKGEHQGLENASAFGAGAGELAGKATGLYLDAKNKQGVMGNP
jgi:hypothetical protein